MAFYKSTYTGAEIDQRLKQGTYEDAVTAGYTGTKSEFDTLLGRLQEISSLASDAQPKIDSGLDTFNKEIVAAINEIYGQVSNAYVTGDELATLLDGYTIATIETDDGISIIQNEETGGGPKYRHVDGTHSYVGVNNGGADGITVQIYSKDSSTNVGTRINVYNKGAYYVPNMSNTDANYQADGEKYEIAVKGDLDSLLADIDSKYVLQEIEGDNGVSRIYQHKYGGGPMFVDNEGTTSYVGVNDGINASGLTGQMYSHDGTNVTRLNLYTKGIYYHGGRTFDDEDYVPDDSDKELAVKGDIPSNVSELTNDVGYITSDALTDYAKTEDLPTIPSNISEFTNDAGYITSSALEPYAKTEDIPTTTSDLTNDSDYITSSALTEYAKTEDVPTKTSDLTNDSDYVTSSALSSYAKTEDIPTVPSNVSSFTNDAGYVIGSSVSRIEVVSSLPSSPSSTTLYLVTS